MGAGHHGDDIWSETPEKAERDRARRRVECDNLRIKAGIHAIAGMAFAGFGTGVAFGGLIGWGWPVAGIALGFCLLGMYSLVVMELAIRKSRRT